MGTQLRPEKGTFTATQFLTHVYCGERAGWINMSLGTKVNVDPGDVVLNTRICYVVMLDGVAAPPKTGTAPVFGSCVLWPNG